MSFLAGRLAGKEGAFFYEQTKRAVIRLSENNPSSVAPSTEATSASHADILPEVLRHSLPRKGFNPLPPSADSQFSPSKWNLNSPIHSNLPRVSTGLVSPLGAYVSFPQVTFGPKRWELPARDYAFAVSTANELRTDRAPGISDKRKDAMVGLTMISKAFAVATALVFGVATIVFGAVASKLDLQNTNDVRTKVRERAQPKFEMIMEKMSPLRCWVDKTKHKWHMEGNEAFRDKPIVQELSKIFVKKPGI